MTLKCPTWVMAGLCCLLPFLSMAQETSDSYYTARWKTVDSLLNKRVLPQSALAQVNLIYTHARQDKNEPQLLKALIYRVRLGAMNQDDASGKAISELEKEIPGAAQPARSILQSILAELYWNYLQQHRRELYSRTQTEGYKKDSIGTWGIDDLHKKIGGLYLSSLQEEKLLLVTRLESYEPVLVDGNMRHLRPTLFDLLAHRALDYFKTDEQDLTRPEYVFEMEDPAIFADAADFVRHSFKTSDSLSLHYKALLLLQRLIGLHLADAKPDALLDVDIERLDFVNRFAVMEDKGPLYTTALTNLATHWGQEPAASQAWYLLAQQLFNKANHASPEDIPAPDDYAKAKTICEKVLTEKDNSEGKTNCAALLERILEKSLKVEMKGINLPDQPILALVDWSNLSRFHGRIIKADRSVDEAVGHNIYDDAFWLKVLQLPALRTIHQALPETKDYRPHAAEIRIDALPVGEYALIASADSAFDQAVNPLGIVYFKVNRISYVNSKNNYFILDRQTGQPLQNATVQVWDIVQKNNARTTRRLAEKYSTDKYGYFYFKRRKDNEQGSVAIEINTGKDRLYTDIRNPDYLSPYITHETAAENETANLTTYFFTDRSIYRPGQTVYFKGILISNSNDRFNPRIVPEFRQKVGLYDVNNNLVDSMDVTTNEFGSYHGAFKLPENLLNGIFYIRDATYGRVEFSVEEYKRPAFYVAYDTLKGSYRVGDSIRIEGYAKAYAGNIIDGALVKYRVARQVHYFYPCLGCMELRSTGAAWAGWGPVRQNVQEIIHGTVKTDAAGKFRIVFPATPDRSIDKSTDPVFEYTLTADVTDINGETRSGQNIVRAGYKSMTLSIDPPSEESLPVNSLRELVVHASNLSGATVPAVVHVTMTALQAPGRMIQRKSWSTPDQFILPREEYLRDFPHDNYDDELNYEKWKRGKKIIESTDSAGKLLPITAGGEKLSPGWYVIEAESKDNNGEAVKVKRYVNLYDGATGYPGVPQYSWATQEEQTVEPGAKARIDIGSSAEKVFVIRRIYRGAAADEFIDTDTAASEDRYSFLALDKEVKSLELPVAEADRGGFWISDVFVKDNNVFTREYTIHVPWTNKELSIHYDTYRDKTLPGSEEKWKVTIQGRQKDKVAAEVLASMYDASLDQFKPHGWSDPHLYPIHQALRPWNVENFSTGMSGERYVSSKEYSSFFKLYDGLIHIDLGGRGGRKEYMYRLTSAAPSAAPMYKALAPKEPGKPDIIAIPDMVNDPDGSKGLTMDPAIRDEDSQPVTADPAAVQIRKNFNETAFFFPDLRTDDSGSVSFSFTMPEALTRWKGMILAHTKDLAFGYSENTVVTQKKLMVQPNVPRFLREGDRMELAVKVVNLADSEMTGQIELQLTDPTTGQTADGIFSNRQANQYFTVGAGQSDVVSFPIDVPFQYNRPLTYRVVARAKTYSDGEEASLPVVSNRMLVTESLPLNMPGDGSKEFHFDKLLQSGNSETLNHHALTVEFTSNPAWYAVQALPYLMEYPYECAEQTFNRFYANALASNIANSSPRLQEVFNRWKTTDTAALLSNLEKNQELKSVLLQETPWVLEGKSESQQKQHIALLFDMIRMSRELESSLTKLKDMQSSNGGFVWFKGGQDDRYITQYILTGIGHLQKLKAIPPSMTEKVKSMVAAALPYLDRMIKKDYEDILKREKGKKPVPAGQKIGPIWIGELPVHYLYMRSLFSDYGIPGDVFPAVNYFRKQMREQWQQNSKYMQGMIALALFRTGDVQTAKNILASLRETAIRDEEKGMYWKGMESGYYWWQAPIETQSLLIEAFHEIAPGMGQENALRTWLLRQKQTHNWSTTKATADACYALLLGGGDWLSAERNVSIRLGDKTMTSGDASGASSTAAEAGTGYFKQVVDGNFVRPSMGNINVTMKTAGTAGTPSAAGGLPAWGAVYWQYFENLDRITVPGNTKASLKLVKKLFIEKNTDRGPVLEPVAENGVLHPGDKVRVRIELQVDRDLEYVHMKDMRAACMEPVNVLSGYRWQGGLGYYESTHDASTDFFFSYLPKGTFVFEYPLFVGQVGNFSNGVTNIECMYAPEFGYHSEGIRVNVEEPLP